MWFHVYHFANVRLYNVDIVRVVHARDFGTTERECARLIAVTASYQEIYLQQPKRHDYMVKGKRENVAALDNDRNLCSAYIQDLHARQDAFRH